MELVIDYANSSGRVYYDSYVSGKTKCLILFLGSTHGEEWKTIKSVPKFE